AVLLWFLFTLSFLPSPNGHPPPPNLFLLNRRPISGLTLPASLSRSVVALRSSFGRDDSDNDRFCILNGPMKVYSGSSRSCSRSRSRSMSATAARDTGGGL